MYLRSEKETRKNGVQEDVSQGSHKVTQFCSIFFLYKTQNLFYKSLTNGKIFFHKTFKNNKIIFTKSKNALHQWTSSLEENCFIHTT